jgi:hypothetical protein
VWGLGRFIRFERRRLGGNRREQILGRNFEHRFVLGGKLFEREQRRWQGGR